MIILYIIFVLMIVNIEKFHKRTISDVLMFGYVNALLFNLPTTTIEKALLNFAKFHKNCEEINIETARQTFYRMQKEFHEVEKS